MEKNTKRGAPLSALLSKYYSGDQMKNEKGRACGLYGRQQKRIQGFGGETGGKETTWKT